jgi:hypothetical protein
MSHITYHFEISKTISQPQIDHIIIELTQAGIFGAVEGHITRSDFSVVADFILCKDLTGRSLITGKIHTPKAKRILLSVR